MDPVARAFYCETLDVFGRAGIEMLVGGAYAFACYTGIERHTKDLDVFVRTRDFQAALEALAAAGYSTEATYPHWLGKAYQGDYYVDVIHNSGNGIAAVDDVWFLKAPRQAVFDVPVSICPAEEMIWSKAFVQERERFDGADVAHLLRARAEQLDWARLLDRFGAHWRVLLAHLVLFGFIYPGEHHRIPGWVLENLLRRVESSMSAPVPEGRVCRGTLLSRQQYLIDVERWGYADARGRPDNPMSQADIASWTEAIAIDGSQ